MVRSGLDVIGAQADMAASLRTTVESLQVLTWAGELAGVSIGEIELATKKLTTRLSEAAAGSGSAVGALQRLNLTAADLQALPLNQRIVAIQEALNQFVPEAERAAVASDLFGDRAALAFLRIDSATLREAAQDVQDFGVAVSAADAAQIERTGDAIAKLSLIWLGLTNRLAMATDDLLASRDQVDATDLAGRRLLTLDKGHRLSRIVYALAAAIGGMVSDDYEGTSLDSILLMAATGSGIAVILELFARRQAIHRDEVVVRPLKMADANRDIALLFAAGRQNGQGDAQFTEALQETALSMGLRLRNHTV